MQRVDAATKVTGSASYAGDLRTREGTDVAVTVLADVGRCSVIIDEAAGYAVQGVRAIITHRNAPRLKPANAISGSELSSLLPLQDDRVLYAGQCVAVVVADTLLAAQTAASAITLRYENISTDELIVHLDDADERLREVRQAGTSKGVIKRGRVGRPTDGDTVTIDVTYRTSALHHNAMEPGAVVAAWDPDGSLAIQAPVQWTEMAALALAQVFSLGLGDRFPGTLGRVLGISDHQRQVRVTPTFAGGAFGRNNSELFLVLAAIAAKINGRAVTLQFSREDTFSLMPCRGETRERITFVARKDGTLIDFTATLDAALGAAGEFIEPLGEGIANIYACPNVMVKHRIARLDLSPTGWMRAPGLASGMFALESAIDELAAELWMDPLQLRLRNYSENDPQSGKPWSSKSLKACYEAGARAIGWHNRPQGDPESEGVLVGYGMAGSFHPNRQFPGSARVLLHPDGRAEVETCVTELGQGILTALTMLSAEALGLAPEVVTLRWNDPLSPPGAPTFASAGTLSNGAAVTTAAQKVRRALVDKVRKDRMSRHFGQPDITIKDGAITSSAGVEPVTAAMARIGETLSASATRGRGSALLRGPSGAFGAIFARVAVDAATDEIRVDKMVGAFGCGRVVNPSVLRGQLQGAMIWGVGHALFEQTRPDRRTGRWVNRNLAEALVATQADVPEIEIILIEEDDTANHPTGLKGGGELGLVGAAAAIANAVFDATGRRIRELPIDLRLSDRR